MSAVFTVTAESCGLKIATYKVVIPWLEEDKDLMTLARLLREGVWSVSDQPADADDDDFEEPGPHKGCHDWP